MAELSVRRLGYALGAAIRGVDLRRPLDDATVDAINRVQFEYLMVCFPDQDLSREEYVAFCSRLCELDVQAPVRLREENPALRAMFEITNKPVNGKPWDGYKDGVGWHSDRSVSIAPTPRSFAYAKEIPEVGGDTLFANQYMAYETLSPAMRRIVDGLSLIHDVSRFDAYHQQGTAVAKNYPYPPVVHPAARVHPITGRKALYVGRGYCFEGMTEEESRPLIDFLNAHGTRYEFCYRHRWRVNDLVIWDNRALMHNALVDYDQRQPRVLWRAAEKGPETGRLVETRQAAGVAG